MADVSLDDLIKKDKEQGKVKRLQQVLFLPLRNLSPRSSSKAINLITKPTLKESHKITTSIRTSLSKKAESKTIAKISNSSRRGRNKNLDLNRKRRKKKDNKERSSSAHLKSWV